MDLIELNEAFAAQALAVMREWKFTPADLERTNVHGSGISLGHPVSATGGRMLATLARELVPPRTPATGWRPCVSAAARAWPRCSNGSRAGAAVTRLAQTLGLTEFQTEIVSTVRQFVDKEIIPVAQELEHADTYPQAIVDQMKEMGLFGLMIPEEYGGLGESLLTYALCVEELARGWMSISGVINTHFIVAYMIRQHGTEEQKRYHLTKMATGESRGAFSMSEPELGSDVAAIRTRARRDGRRQLRHRRPEDVADQRWQFDAGGGAGAHRRGCGQTAPQPDRVPRREAVRLRRSPSGTDDSRQDRQARLQGHRHHRIDLRRLPGRRPTRCSASKPGQGFFQMMDGIEVGRVNVSARACGVGIRAFELAARYAQQRSTFGKPIAEHQAIAFQLAEMATKVEAAHLMMVNAARLKDSGERNDVAAGMAKYLCQ